MGRGLAKEAAKRYPWLPPLYGEFCHMHGTDTPVTFNMRSRIILFPTKPLNEKTPWASWKSKASPYLIRKSAKQLNDILLPHKDLDWPGGRLETNHVLVPPVGCGGGRLYEEDVFPILHEELDDRYTLFIHQPF